MNELIDPRYSLLDFTRQTPISQVSSYNLVNHFMSWLSSEFHQLFYIDSLFIHMQVYSAISFPLGKKTS